MNDHPHHDHEDAEHDIELDCGAEAACGPGHCHDHSAH